MPRKSKKQRPSTTTTSTLATRRHWIYTTTGKSNSSSQYDSYLHQRVQRVLVRSVPSNFSYFNDSAVNNGEFVKKKYSVLCAYLCVRGVALFEATYH